MLQVQALIKTKKKVNLQTLLTYFTKLFCFFYFHIFDIKPFFSTIFLKELELIFAFICLLT